MVKSISFTPTAHKQLDKTIAYIQQEFGIKAVNKFLDALELKLGKIAEGFITHKLFNTKQQIRYFMVQRKNYILYKETKTSIKVVGVYGVKQNILRRTK